MVSKLLAYNGLAIASWRGSLTELVCQGNDACDVGARVVDKGNGCLQDDQGNRSLGCQN
ncbi:MAG: hypothetical protein KME13_18665 [Myxacorys californica WJT36-NPBG1]|nr:hypothetical protein [Myxacorys californica WJT36-NPBG1]